MRGSILAALVIVGLSACGSDDAATESSTGECPTGTYRLTTETYGFNCYDGCNYVRKLDDGSIGSTLLACPGHPSCPATPPAARSPASSAILCQWQLDCGVLRGFTFPDRIAGAPPGYRWYFSSSTCPVDTTP